MIIPGGASRPSSGFGPAAAFAELRYGTPPTPRRRATRPSPSSARTCAQPGEGRRGEDHHRGRQLRLRLVRSRRRLHQRPRRALHRLDVLRRHLLQQLLQERHAAHHARARRGRGAARARRGRRGHGRPRGADRARRRRGARHAFDVDPSARTTCSTASTTSGSRCSKPTPRRLGGAAHEWPWLDGATTRVPTTSCPRRAAVVAARWVWPPRLP